MKVLYPFNFNSVYRRGDFLFSKIFKSIIRRTPVSIGDTYFERELLHPRFVVEQSLKSTTHQVIGMGVTFSVNQFIRDLYLRMNLDYDELVIENLEPKNWHRRSHVVYADTEGCSYTYDKLLENTVSELQKVKEERKSLER